VAFEWLNKGETNGIWNDGCRSSAYYNLLRGFDSSNPHSFILLRSRELVAQKTNQQYEIFIVNFVAAINWLQTRINWFGQQWTKILRSS